MYNLNIRLKAFLYNPLRLSNEDPDGGVLLPLLAVHVEFLPFFCLAWALT